MPSGIYLYIFFSHIYTHTMPNNSVNSTIQYAYIAAVILASMWWLCSGLYSVFISNFSADWWNPASDILSSTEFRRSTFVGTGLFPDEDVSLWSEGISWITVVVHVALMLVPLPGLLLGQLWKRKEDSEEVFFVLAAVSSLSLVGAQINSVRYAYSIVLQCNCMYRTTINLSNFLPFPSIGILA